MPYVLRDPLGQIASLHREAPAGGGEFLADSDNELQAFIGSTAPGRDFNRLDADFVRVLEDLIDALISRNLLNITDLPEQAQAKLFARKSYRERVAKNPLQLFGEGDLGLEPIVRDTGFADL